MSKKCQIISAIQQKGGSGKTTLICMLASFLAEDGARIAIVDADPLQGASDFAIQSEKAGLTIDYVQELDEAVIVKKVRALAKMDYDVVFIDTAGIDSKATDYAVQLSDLVFIPVKAARPDVKGLMRSLKIVEGVSDLKERDIPALVVMSDADKGTNITKTMSAAIKEKKCPMLNSQMLHRTGFKEFLTTGGKLTGSARTIGRAVLAELQINGNLNFYKSKQAA